MKTEIFKTSDGRTIVKYVAGHPITKTVLYTGVMVVLFFIAGKIMQILTGMVMAYKSLNTALKLPTFPAKVAA
jgi:hypothetical protein